MRITLERVWIVVAGAAFLCAPGLLMAVVAAMQSRMMIVHVVEPSAEVMKTFEASAAAAGLVCKRSDQYEGRAAVDCVPPVAGRNEGGVTVVDVPEKKAVVVSAFARNTVTPQGELHPAIDATLRSFREALSGNPQVLRVDYCWAPKLKACSLPNRP